MGKIDFNQGEVHIVLETGDETLVSEFERIFCLIKTGMTIPIKPGKKTSIASVKAEPEVADAEEAPGPKPELTFGKYLTSLKKLTKPEIILAYGEWTGKPFSSKEFFQVEKERGALKDEDRKAFHPRLTGLKKAGKVRTVSKGLYELTKAGKQTLDKKRK